MKLVEARETRVSEELDYHDFTQYILYAHDYTSKSTEGWFKVSLNKDVRELLLGMRDRWIII